jgi:hypothetical protein
MAIVDVYMIYRGRPDRAAELVGSVLPPPESGERQQAERANALKCATAIYLSGDLDVSRGHQNDDLDQAVRAGLEAGYSENQWYLATAEVQSAIRDDRVQSRFARVNC